MMAFVTFRGSVITFVMVLWHDLSHRSLLVQLKKFTDIKSWDELSKNGKPLKKAERHVFLKLFCDTH